MTVYGVTIGGSFCGAPNPCRNAFNVRRAPSPQNPTTSLTTDTVSYLHCRKRAPSGPRGIVEIRMRAGADGRLANRHLTSRLGLAADFVIVAIEVRLVLRQTAPLVFGGA